MLGKECFLAIERPCSEYCIAFVLASGCYSFMVLTGRLEEYLKLFNEKAQLATTLEPLKDDCPF
jgi:hypothetical protein